MRSSFSGLADQVEAFMTAAERFKIGSRELHEIQYDNANSPTTLAALGRDEVLGLIVDGYIQATMASAYLLAASRTPLADTQLLWPGRARFEQLLR